MARTRAGLSGRPTCRPGVICPGLSAPQGWPLAAMSAGLPVGTLRPCLTSAVDPHRAASAALRFAIWPQASRSSCLGCSVVLLPWCRTAAGFGRGGGATLRGVPRFIAAMAVGHPFIGRGSRPKVGGTPKGCPGRRPLAAFRFAQTVRFPQIGLLQLLEKYF